MELFAEEITLVENNLEVLEALVNEKIRLLGKGLLQRLVNHDPNGYHISSNRCRCGRAMRFVAHHHHDIHTLLGCLLLNLDYCCNRLRRFSFVNSAISSCRSRKGSTSRMICFHCIASTCWQISFRQFIRVTSGPSHPVCLRALLSSLKFGLGQVLSDRYQTRS